MNRPPATRPARFGLLQRLLPLALLGSALALVVVQLTRAVTHEVALRVSLAPRLTSELESVEVQVTRPDGKVASLTIFHFDDSHRPATHLEHTLRLTDGRYAVVFKLLNPAGVRQFQRRLDVSGDVAVRFHLP